MRKPNIWLTEFEGKKGKTYRVVWRVKSINRKYDSRGFGDNKEAAERFKDEKRAALHRQPAIGSISGNVTFSQFASIYLATARQDIALTTITNFDNPAIRDFGAVYGAFLMPKIHKLHLADFKTRLYGELKYKRNTVSMRLRALKALFSYAKEMGVIETVPFPKKFIPDFEFNGRYLTTDILNAALEKLIVGHPLMYRVCLFLLYTGLRRHEVVGLDWADVRTNKDGFLVATIRRKGAYRRTTKVALRDIIIHPKAEPLMGVRRDSGQVFQGLTESVINKQLRLKAGFRCHDLRHTWATNFMQETGDLPGLMKLGGWSQLKAVEVYQHLSRARAESVLSLNYDGLATKSATESTKEIDTHTTVSRL